MKDITVALELTVDSDMSDEAVKVFVEDIIRNAVQNHLSEITTFEVDRHLIDVVAITEGTFVDFTLPEWRHLPYRRQ